MMMIVDMLMNIIMLLSPGLDPMHLECICLLLPGALFLIEHLARALLIAFGYIVL